MVKNKKINMENFKIQELTEVELRSINGGIGPAAALGALAAGIAIYSTLAYGAGYAYAKMEQALK